MASLLLGNGASLGRMLALFILFSIPIGCFALWFGWQARKVGRTRVTLAMVWMALFCFGSAFIVGGWAWLFSQS